MAGFTEDINCSESDTESPANEQDIETSKEEQIQSLQDLMPLRTDINFSQCNDILLLHILEARRFDLANSFELLCSYLEFRRKNVELFDNLKVSELRYAIEDGFPCVLPTSDPDGSTILVLFPGTWDTESFTVEILMKTCILSLEYLSQNSKVRECGIVLLVDFSGWTTNHATKLNIGILRKIIAVFQDCSTVWFKNVHLINQPWYINAFITVTKPFMKDNVQERIVIHGNNMSTLHKYIPQEILPAEFGGSKPEVDQCYWANILLTSEKRKVERRSTFREGINPFRAAEDETAQNGLNLMEETESLLSHS